MKTGLYFLLLFGFCLTPLMLASASKPSPASASQQLIKQEDLGKIALGSSILGVAMIAIPPLSGLGLAFALIGLGLGIYSRKKGKRKIFSRLAIILSSLVLSYFLVILGLVIFY